MSKLVMNLSGYTERIMGGTFSCSGCDEASFFRFLALFVKKHLTFPMLGYIIYVYGDDGTDCRSVPFREKAAGASFQARDRCFPRSPAGNCGVRPR